MEKDNVFLASRNVAERTGFIAQRYVTKDGRFVVSARDLRNVRLTEQEYVTGLDVTAITSDEAKRLIKENKYTLGKARNGK